jgi:outer membrane protein OmpA-like peptidoglycan-associated protein
MKKVLFFALIFSVLYAQEENVLLGEIEKQFETLQGESINLEEDERGVVLMFSSQLLFEFGKADLTDEAKTNLNKVSKILEQYSSVLVEIEGHADNVGSSELNQELSENRARNVANYLIELGIDEKNLRSVGYGKERPIADNRTEEGRAKNRRVELVVKREVLIVRKQEPPPPEPIPEPVPEPEPAPAPEPKKKLHLAIRISPCLYSFSLGDDRDENIDLGWGFGVGGVARFKFSDFTETPIAKFLTLSAEASFYWRKLAVENYMGEESWPSELALSLPAMIQLTPVETVPFYLAAGFQLDIPILPEWKSESGKVTSSRDYSDRAWLDFGVALGLGYRIVEKIEADLRFVIGLSSPDLYEDNSSFNQYGIGVTYFF